MSYEIDLETIKPKSLAPYILHILNEGRNIGENIISSEKIFKGLIGRLPTFKSEWLLFKNKFSSARGYLRRKKFNDIWIEPRKYLIVNKRGSKVQRYGYSIAKSASDYTKAVEIIDDMIGKLDQGKKTRIKIIRNLKNQKKLMDVLKETEQ